MTIHSAKCYLTIAGTRFMLCLRLYVIKLWSHRSSYQLRICLERSQHGTIELVNWIRTGKHLCSARRVRLIRLIYLRLMSNAIISNYFAVYRTPLSQRFMIAKSLIRHVCSSSANWNIYNIALASSFHGRSYAFLQSMVAGKPIILIGQTAAFSALLLIKGYSYKVLGFCRSCVAGTIWGILGIESK